MDVDGSGRSDRMAVIGRADLERTDFFIRAGSGPYDRHYRYLLVDADSVTDVGEGSVENSPMFYSFAFEADADKLFLTATNNLINTDPASGNGQPVYGNSYSAGSYINNHIHNAQGDWLAVLAELNKTGSKLPEALNQLHPEPYGITTSVGFTQSELATDTVTAGNVSYQQDALPTTLAFLSSDRRMTAVPTERSLNGMSVWARGIWGASDLNGKKGLSGYETSVSGVALGVDTLSTSSLLTVGVGLAFTESETDLDVLDFASDGEGVTAVIHGRYLKGDTVVKAAASIGSYDYDTTRRIRFAGVDREARAAFDVDVYGLRFSYGRYTTIEEWDVKHEARLSYLATVQNPFEETGADSLNLSVGALECDSLESSLGATMSRRYTLSPERDGDRWFSPSLHIAWRHEYLDDGSRSVDGELAAIPQAASALHVESVPQPDDTIELGAGLTASLSENVSIGVQVGMDAFLAARSFAYSGQFLINVRF